MTIAIISAFSQEVSFETITEALNYNGDKDAVKKLIITETIRVMIILMRMNGVNIELLMGLFLILKRWKY
jgi:hypothetical protein